MLLGDRTLGREMLERVGMAWLLHVLTCLLTLLPWGQSQMPITNKFLNSYVHCGHGDSKEPFSPVHQSSVYNVRDEANPDQGSHAFRACQLIFRSTRRDGRLCVLQRHLKFDSCFVALELYDGWADVDGVSKPNKTVSCHIGLSSVEWCTTGRYLTVGMTEIGAKPSVRDVHIDLLVYDMQSVHRKAYMDSLPSCGSHFLMDGSRVNITNLDPVRKVEQLFPECKLTFKYAGKEKNRSLCMVFEACTDSNHNCSRLNYTLEVFSYPGSGNSEVLSGTRSCDRPFPRRWCSNTTKLSLLLHRKTSRLADPSAPTLENAVVFNALVLDHEGGPETLPRIFEPQPVASSRPDHLMTMVIIVSVLSAAAILVILLVIFCRRRRKQTQMEKERNGDSGAPMVTTTTSSNADTACPPENGRELNHYSDGPPGSPPVFV